MYVHSIHSISTDQQQKHSVSQIYDVTPNGDSNQGLSFQECLRSRLQQASEGKMTRNAEFHAAAGIFWGFYPTLKEQQKQESTLKKCAG